MDQCVLNVYEALKDASGRPRVRRETIESWADEIKMRPKYDPGLLEKEMVERGRQRIHDAYIRRRNTALSIQARGSMLNYIINRFDGDPVKGMISFLRGVQSGEEGSRRSVAAHQRNISGAYASRLSTKLKRAGLEKDAMSGDFSDQISMEIADLASKKPTGKATGNKKAAAIARIIYDEQQYARKRANAAGADIGELEGYFMAQTHDMFRVRKVDRDTWVDTVLTRLDKERTFGDANISDLDAKNILGRIYADFASGAHMKVDYKPPQLMNGRRGSNVGSALSSERFLHFKDVKSALEYNKMFGRSDNILENVFYSMDNLAKKTALMEMLGPNPEATIDWVVANLDNRYKSESAHINQDKANALKAKRKQVDNIMRVLDGSSSIPANDMVAMYSQIFRQVQSMAKLGGAAITAVVDVAVAASELRYQGNSALSSYHRSITGGFGSVPAARRKELSAMTGVYAHAAMNSLTEKYSGFDDIGTLSGISGSMSRATNTFFKLSGLSWWTDRMRINMSLAMSARLGEISGKPWSKIDPDLQRVLGLFDIGEQDWSVISKAIDKEGDYKFITPEGVMALDDSVIAATHPGRKADEVRQEISDKLRSYFIDRADHAVLMPDAGTAAMLRMGTAPGTVEGEAIRMIMQFKAYPVAFAQKIIGRSLYGKGGLDASGIMEMAHLIASTTALGYLAMSAKDALKGREPRDPAAVSTWIAAMAQGGAAGIYGDFILGSSNRFGGSLIATLAGPAATTGESVWNLYADIRDGLTGLNDDPDVGASALKILQGNTPFINLFYLKAALDYSIMYRLQESMNPGYLERMEARTEEQNKQGYIEFLRPSNVIPYGGGF
jgi:hypothetical protein